MRRSIYLIIALITFAVGIASVLVWQSKRASLQSSQAETISEIDRGIIDPRWVYVNRDIKWQLEKPPKMEDVSKIKQWDADALFVIFYPSGEYAEVWVALWKWENPQRIFFAPNGDSGYVTYKGKWVTNSDGTISTFASYSHVGYYNLPPSDIQSVHRSTWTIRQPAVDRLGTLLETGGEEFIPASEIEDEDLNDLRYFVKDLDKDSKRQ